MLDRLKKLRDKYLEALETEARGSGFESVDADVAQWRVRMTNCIGQLMGMIEHEEERSPKYSPASQPPPISRQGPWH